MKGVIRVIISISISFIFLSNLQAQAQDYYISPTGNDANDGLTEVNAWATFAHADSMLQPGDNCIIMDGTYDQRIVPHNSGTEEGGYITYKAQNNLQAIIAPTTIPTPDSRSAIDVFSCPSCGGGWDNPVIGYIAFEGLFVRAWGEQSAIRLSSRDDATEPIMTHHIIVKNCGFYGSAQETNTPVLELGNNLRDSLIEDVFSFGKGRKAGEAFGCVRIILRRAVLRYDYWEGDSYKPNDPRTTFSGYNTHDSIFENIIVVDTAPTPPGYSADRGGFAAAGNETPAAISGSARNKYLGLIVLNNYGNGVEVNGGSGDPNEDLVFKNIFLWDNLDNGYGMNIQGNDDASKYSFITVGNSFVGLRFDPYPHAPITNEIMTNSFSVNSQYGWFYDAGQIATFENNTRLNNTEQDDVEAQYAPDISTRFLDPIMIAGHERGATIVNRYVDGVQTAIPLWPYPNEDIIKQHMCNLADLTTAHRIAANGEGWKPGWCGTNKTLTEYIWEYNGAICPEDICTDSAVAIRADVDQSSSINSTDALLTLRNSLGLNMSSTNWQVSSTTGDVNCDSNSNSTDALLILRESLGLDMTGTGWCG